MSRSTFVCIVIWAAAFAYAIVRYVIVGPVPATEIPLFILNKSLSFAAIVLFSVSYLVPRGHARAFGVTGTWLAVAHAMITVTLLATGSFDSLRTVDGQLTLRGQIVVLLGVASLFCLLWQRRSLGARTVRVVRLGVVASTVLHVTVLGGSGWFTPERWHGGLVPITMLAALAGCIGIVAGLRRGARASHDRRSTRTTS